MNGISAKSLWGYLGRFTLVHVVVCTVITVIFLSLQDGLPASQRVALEYFEPYPYPSLFETLDQVFRGVVLSLILYPFYETVVGDRRGWLILFGALWGLALFGAVEPMPGSIEGMIYTETSWVEHLVVLAAGAVQALLFSWLFLCWERRSNKQGRHLGVMSGGVNDGTGV